MRFSDLLFFLYFFWKNRKSIYISCWLYNYIYFSYKQYIIIHYIDFSSFNYKEGDEFDLLVYAVQVNNSKLEFLYDIITGKIGKIQGIQKIEGFIEGKPDYST